MKELECIWGKIPSEKSCKYCGVACSSRIPKNSSYSSTDFASADSKNDAIGLSIMLYLETNLKNENSKVCGVPLKIAREWLREHINDQPMNITSAGGGMSITSQSYKLDVKPEQPVKGLDVTDFCKPVDPDIAKCVADHWWEMIGEESTNKKPVEGLEEEIDKYFNGWLDDAEYGQAVMDKSRGFLCAGVDDCKDIARHFAEWGAEHLKK